MSARSLSLPRGVHTGGDYCHNSYNDKDNYDNNKNNNYIHIDSLKTLL